MSHNSYPTNQEDEEKNQINSSYSQWQEAMSDVGFRDGKVSDSLEDKGPFASIATEVQKKPVSLIEKLVVKIQGMQEYIIKALGIQNKEKLTEMTDSALVHIAKETIASADEDGKRSEKEKAKIEEAVSLVVVEGAINESQGQPVEENPITELNKKDTQSDLMMSIDSLREEDVELPSGESVAGLAMRVIEREKKWDLRQISGPLGSNEGGWYEEPNGERYYVKFYENPNQGRVEFVANAIYKRLGIKAASSEIIQLDGREAVASLAIPEAKYANMESQRNSDDVQKGFVADAFLANWDVVGLGYDNIVKAKDGFYRIDNGGALIFRARGKDKEYVSDTIPELQSMRVRGRQAGEVFANMTEEEIGRQARELVSKLSPEDIKAVVAESGLKGKEYDRVLTGLLGRREYLAKTYGEARVDRESWGRRPRRTVNEMIREVSDQGMERVGETVVRPRTEIICDRDHIEDQRIDIINNVDRGIIEFKFKLRDSAEITNLLMYELDKNEIEGKEYVQLPSGAVLRRGSIAYDVSSSNETIELCDAFVLEKKGVKISIANPTSREKGAEICIKANSSGLVRTAIGLVKVEMSSEMSPEDIELALDEVLEKDLGIPDALSDVSEKEEREYKLARYKWLYAIDGELTQEQIERAEKMSRKEVFPGYTTFVEEGKHKEYLKKYGEDVRAFHHLTDPDSKMLYTILTGGLMSTTERFSRGIDKLGSSSCMDMDTGGADCVFTRIASEERRGNLYGAIVVLKPELFDRTDWYSYIEDTYGSTDDRVFSKRYSPDAIFNEVTEQNNEYRSGWWPYGNEQMFRTGIGADYIESIEVDADRRNAIITNLRHMGLSEVNGRPIEEIIAMHKSERLEYESGKNEYSVKLEAAKYNVPGIFGDELDEIPEVEEQVGYFENNSANYQEQEIPVAAWTPYKWVL